MLLDNWREHSIIDHCRANEFEQFIDNVLETFPDGYVTWLYSFYAQHATYIGRTENLQQDLFEVLSLFNEAFSTDAIVATPRAKVSSKSLKAKAVYRKSQISELFMVEEEVIRKYGYANAVSFLRFN